MSEEKVDATTNNYATFIIQRIYTAYCKNILDGNTDEFEEFITNTLLEFKRFNEKTTNNIIDDYYKDLHMRSDLSQDEITTASVALEQIKYLIKDK